MSATPGFDTESAAHRLVAELVTVARPERAEQEKRYLRSELTHLGASVPQTRAAVRRLALAHNALGRNDVLALVEALWAEPVHERRLAAVQVAAAYVDRLGPADLALVERLARAAHTWALVDPLAIDVAGGITGRGPVTDPVVARTLDRWATDENLWIRRAALLALLLGLRMGAGDFTRFGRYADALVDEREFFIQKAVGWLLREAGARQPELVVEWLAPRIARVSTVALREAVKRLPAGQREELLARRAEVA